MKHPSIRKQFDTDTRALALSHFSSHRKQQSLNVTPFDASWHWTRKDQCQRFLMFAVHLK